MGNSPKLQLGCGKNYKEGYLNADIVFGHFPVDLIMTLERIPYPFADNSVGEIVMENVLEHLTNVPAVLDELHRVLIPGGRLYLIVPHFTAFQGMGVVGHKHVFHYDTFHYCDDDHPCGDAVYSNRKWHILENEIIFKLPMGNRVFQWVFNRHKHLYTTTGLAYLFPAQQVRFVMQKPGIPRPE